jgi:predicted RNA-binding protein associated with RNAse of E/G family
VTLPVAIPAGFRLVSATPDQGSFDPVSGLWTVGAISAGQSIELRFTIEVIAAGELEVVAGPIHSDEFDASTTDDIARSGVDASTATSAPAAPTVTYPAALITITASSATITGTAEAGTLVKIYADSNGNGLIDEGEVVVGSQQLAPGQTSFAITVPLTPDAANHFLATATDGLGSQSSPAGVPEIDQVSTATFASGVVFLDYNADGLLEAGEPGLAGRVVYADLNHNGVLDAGDITAITDASGHYTFSGVTAGSADVLEAPGQDTYSRYVVDQFQTNPDMSVAISVVPISPVAPVPVVPSPFAATPSHDAYTSYVRSLYRAVLGRDGTGVEVNTWLLKMYAGMTRHEVAEGFVNSLEHRRDQVDAYYQEFLHRGSDPTSSYWVNSLLSGVSEETISEAFLDSPEYQASHQDSALFIHDLYLDVLGRQGEPTGLANWLAALDSGLSREAVVAGFVNSPEAIGQIVTSFYAAYLHRRREPVTSDLWSEMLGTPGGSATEVAADILASPEFVHDAVASAPPGLTGTVYLDNNANGLPDVGEPGLVGRVVFADLNHNGILDSGDITAITDTSGHFLLSGIVAGSAEVLEATGQDPNNRYVVDQFHTDTDGSLAISVVPISPVAPVPVVPNPFSASPSTDPSTAYVQSLYKAVLGRTGTDVEVATWLVKMENGMTRHEVAMGFVNSLEHRRNQVDAYYREFLHRGSDSTSSYWVNSLLSGVSEETISEAFLDSPEYQASHQDSALFIRDLYLDVLGRQGESAGLAGWMSALGSGTTREAIVSTFVESAEAIDQIVRSDYLAFLHRIREGGTTSDLWVKILETPNGSATDVATGILASPEFDQDATTPQG